MARSCYSSIFRFLKNLYTVSHLAAPTCIPTNSMQVFPFVSAFYHKHNAFKVQLPLFSWDCACFRTSVPGKLGLLGILMSLQFVPLVVELLFAFIFLLSSVFFFFLFTTMNKLLKTFLYKCFVDEHSLFPSKNTQIEVKFLSQIIDTI